MQRSITTSRPPSCGDACRLPVHDAELEPQHARTDGDRFDGVRDAQLGSPEDVDQVERPGRVHGVGEGRVGRRTEDLGLGRVDRDTVEPSSKEIPEDAIRRPARVGRRAHDRDPAGRPQDPLDPHIVEDRDRPATLLEVQERSGTEPLLPSQVAASRS